MPSRILRISIALFLATAAFTAPSAAETVKIYASDTLSSHNEGLAPITSLLDWVNGIDYPGDYVEYRFHLSGYGVNSTRITAQGTWGVPFRIRMDVWGDSGSLQTVYFDFVGSGFSG